MKNSKISRNVLSFLLILTLLISPNLVMAENATKHITIIGTSDIHANLYNWSYEDNKEVDHLGMTKVHSVVEKYRGENPNLILLDNGDTIQGTILSDDLYNTKLDVKHPIIDAMNFMKYDAMTLGNHEFNFGLDLVSKIEKEANFPILGANVKYKKDNSDFAKPYTIIERDGVKIGVIGVTNVNIPRWDGSKVDSLEFKNMADTVSKYIDEVKKEADIVVLSAHAGLEDEYGNDGVKEIINKHPEIAAVLVGHTHGTIGEKIGNTVVGGPRNEGREVVKFDLFVEKDGDKYSVKDSSVEIIKTEEYPASEGLLENSRDYHNETVTFIQKKIGTATEDLQPVNEIKGIPEGQLRDTAVIDLINNIQLEATGADISAAALFSNTSNIKKGDINYASVFDIYKFPNTILVYEINGKELKHYMEWSADFYNTYKEGDINISFNPEVRGYRYDMFQGVDYKIDISKPVGERIVDLKFKGEPVKETDTFKLAVNNYRADGIKNEGIIPKEREALFDSDPKSLRAYIVDYISAKGTLSADVDNNWEIIGADLDHPLRDYIIGEVNAGNISLPSSEDGRSVNIKALNVHELIENGTITNDVLKQYELEELIKEEKVEEKPVIEEKPVVEEKVEEEKPAEVEKPVVEKPTTKPNKKYTVKSGDNLTKIAKEFGTTWRKLAEYNKIKNPNRIYPNQVILIP